MDMNLKITVDAPIYKNNFICLIQTLYLNYFLKANSSIGQATLRCLRCTWDKQGFYEYLFIVKFYIIHFFGSIVTPKTMYLSHFPAAVRSWQWFI